MHDTLIAPRYKILQFFFVYVHEKISEKHDKNNNVETEESGL